MSKTSPGKSKARSRKLSPALTAAVIVASIGCLGTVFAALITGAFAFLSSNGVPDFSSSEDSQSIDWQEIVSISHNAPCPPLYYPDNLYSGQNREAWIQENAAQYYSVDQLMYAPTLANSTASNEINIYLTITSTVDTGDWIRLSREASITVTRLDDAPDDSAIIENAQCGGGEFFRYFSPVPLRADFDKYESDTATSDFDYFTLQPGEPEIFIFALTCEAPGIYRVDMNLPYTYQNYEERITFTDINGVVCPDNATYYTTGMIPEVETMILDIATYTWGGSEYERTGP